MLKYIFVNTQELSQDMLSWHVLGTGASGPAVHCGKLQLLNGTSSL